MKFIYSILIYLTIGSSIGITMLSCKKDTVLSSSGTPADYYPLKVGSYHIYLVDSIYYNDITLSAETYQFQMKEEITDTFYDSSNRLNFRLEKSFRYKTDSTSYDQGSWHFSRVWYVTSTNNSIERVEENNRFVSLTNPIKNDLTWNGNAYNYNEKWDCIYENFEEPYLSYSNTVKVLQTDDESLINKKLYEQYFAKGIGIVKYYYIDVESQQSASPKPILERIEKGVQYTQVLIDYYIPE